MYYDRQTKLRQMSIGDPVYVRNFGRGPLWLPGHIVHSTDYVSFQIELLDGRTCRRHIDHVRTRFDREENTTQYDADFPIDNATETNSTDPEVTESTPDPTPSVSIPISDSTNDFESSRSENQTTSTTSTPKRYPKRQTQPPDRYEPIDFRKGKCDNLINLIV